MWDTPPEPIKESELKMSEQQNTKPLEQMSLRQLAMVIEQSWVKMSPHAVPYVAAMRQLETIRDKFGFDDGESVVRYFLVNATTWRGEVARNVKAELNRRLKEVAQ